MTPEVQKEVERLASEYNEYNIPVEEFSDRVNWIWISSYQRLSEPFIREFVDRVDWSLVSRCQRLSESFIREFADRVNWPWISSYQRLSESFIREFTDRVYWPWISMYQQLSEPFIREFADRVDWPLISKHQKLSESFIREFPHRLDIKVQRKKHHKKINKDKAIRKYAKKHDLEYKDGVLTAYRDHDKWGRGSFNGATFYEPGQYYRDWHCDLDREEENSFGLGIWPEGNTKVKVKVEDWGVATKRGDGKARVWGFEVTNEEV